MWGDIMKKRSLGLILFTILIIASIISAGCSGKAANESAPAEPSRADYAAGEQKPAATMPSPAPSQMPDRKLIVMLSLDMRVDNIEKSMLDAETMAAASGGYTRESFQNEFSGQLTVMIPAGKADTFVSSLRSLGKIINSNKKTEDVTDSYFDTQVRIKNLEAEIETMRNLLQKPGWKVSEILEIEIDKTFVMFSESLFSEDSMMFLKITEVMMSVIEISTAKTVAKERPILKLILS